MVSGLRVLEVRVCIGALSKPLKGGYIGFRV